MRSAGDVAGALARLERFLAATGRRLGEPDQAVLRLEAASLAIEVGAPHNARAHLAVSERIAESAAFRPQPFLAARLQRELARQRERLGDVTQVEHLLTRALPALETADLALAAEAFNARGIVRLELLKLSEAEADFRSSFSKAERVQLPVEFRVSVLANLTVAASERGALSVARQTALEARQLAGSSDSLLRIADFANAQVLLRELDVATAESILEQLAQQAAIDDPLRAHALMSLANARFSRGRMPEAVEAATEAVEAYRGAVGERHPAYGRALHTLGTALSELGDPVSAATALAQAAQILSAAFGPSAIQVQGTEIERGWLELRAGDLSSAERRVEAALRAYATTPPPDARPVGLALILRGLVAEAAGRRDLAAEFYRQGQVRITEARGANSPDLGFSLVRLGRLLTRMGRYQDAALPLDRAISIYSAAGSAGTVRLAEALTARAELRALAGERRGALGDTRTALALLRERISAVEQTGGGTGSAQRRGARELYAAQARLLVSLQAEDRQALNDAFMASQESLTSRAGDALRRAALRRAAAGGQLGRLLGDRESATEAMNQADSLLLTSAAGTSPFDPAELRRLRAARDDAAIRIRALDTSIEAQFPRIARFLRPQSIALEDVQTLLDVDEAIVAPVVTEDGVLIWGVRRDAAEAIFLPVGSAEISSLVQRIRRGVDLGLEAHGRSLDPFDVTAARALHDAVFLPLDRIGLLDRIQHVIVVPDGALQSIPAHLLLDTRHQWLIQRFAFTTAPTIGAFVASREERGRPSQAQLSFLGVGDPDFAGYADPGRVSRRGPPQRLRRELAQLSRLTDTADEVKRLAEIFGERESRLLLHTDATERALTEIDLRQFQVVSFSTHALMAGEVPGLTEPAIVLTPTDDDAPLDGLLTASDIAALELDAQLVLLSACNTAAPDGGPYAEGMSGLARAFLQAGARALLVSHWTVESAATVKLTTDFAVRTTAASDARRPNALRGAILQMISSEDASMRHPAMWGPFVLVGG
nr:CHAT domain-containing tetratricopeptide repeat protein [Roseomonas rosulenta]